MKKYLLTIKARYERYERHISSLALVGGFVFDIIALKRVDLFWENLWVLAHLLVAAFFILLLNYHLYRRHGVDQEYRVYSLQFWLIFIIQFAFGGLLSTFLVFYFRSATLSAAWPFLLLLALAFVGNEVFKKRYARLSYQTSVLFLSIFSFAIFIVPVIVHRLGDDIFLLSGLVSLIAITIFVRLLWRISREIFHQHKKILIASIAGIYLVINLLYFTNLIPPLPLSLKDAAIYHQIERNAAGNYDVQTEPHRWQDYFSLYQPIHLAPGQSLYAYSAIFSPAQLNVTVIHEWQYYDQTKGDWFTTGRIALPITGGRDNGFRTYSFRSDLSPGKWRVNVLTPSGLLIGRIKFDIQTSPTSPALVTEEVS